MVEINYIEHNGNAHRADVEPGSTVMQGAVHQGIPGIDADCGGSCVCATCHVYIDPKWVKLIAPPSQEEIDMLEFAEDVRKNSRLSCQIRVTPELAGLIVRTPARQR